MKALVPGREHGPSDNERDLKRCSNRRLQTSRTEKTPSDSGQRLLRVAQRGKPKNLDVDFSSRAVSVCFRAPGPLKRLANRYTVSRSLVVTPIRCCGPVMIGHRCLRERHDRQWLKESIRDGLELSWVIQLVLSEELETYAFDACQFIREPLARMGSVNTKITTAKRATIAHVGSLQKGNCRLRLILFPCW
jgi:hypothetical protein